MRIIYVLAFAFIIGLAIFPQPIKSAEMSLSLVINPNITQNLNQTVNTYNITGGGANASSITCPEGERFSAYDNSTGLFTCTAGAGGSSFNETYANTSILVNANVSRWEAGYNFGINGTFINTWNASVGIWNSWLSNYTSGYNKTAWDSAYAYATNGSFINYLNSTVGNWNTAYTYATNSTFAQINEPRWADNYSNGYNKTAWDKSYAYSTNGTFINYLNSTVARWNSWESNITACTNAQKLYFNGQSLACANDIYNTTAQIWSVANNGTFVNAWNSSIPIWNSFQNNITACTNAQKLYFNGNSLACANDIYNTSAQIWGVCNNGTFVNYLNSSFGNYQKAFEYATNGSFVSSQNASVLNQTATAILPNVQMNMTTPINTTSTIFAQRICLTNSVSCDVFVNATGIYFNGSKKMIVWNATHFIFRNTGS